MGKDYSNQDLATIVVGTALAMVAVYLGQLAHDRVAVALAAIGLLAGYLANAINGPWEFSVRWHYRVWLTVFVTLAATCITTTTVALFRVLVL